MGGGGAVGRKSTASQRGAWGAYSLVGPRGARGSIWVPSTWIKRRGSRLSGTSPGGGVGSGCAVADLETCERVVPCACVKVCWMLTFFVMPSLCLFRLRK